MTAAKRQLSIADSKPSFLLTKDENELLSRLIGARCKSLASTVVQVCFADPPNRNQWNKRHCGVLCFVKDNIKRSYFLRLFCLNRQMVVWEQELYSTFDYRAPRPYFHTFEGDDSRIGFNFADESEAEFFLEAIKENLRSKAERRERRRQMHQNNVVHPMQVQNTAMPTANGSAIQAPRSMSSLSSMTSSSSSLSTKKNKKDKGRKITKADIGLPSDFKHVSHVGWDPNQGFALENVNPDLLQFFAKAGVSESHLKDKATRDFIYDFIDKHGGTEAAIREISNHTSPVGGGLLQAPPVPARNPPSTPQTARMAPIAPPAATPPPPPPSKIVASPPHTAPPVARPPAPQPKITQPDPIQPSPIMNNVPPPPPPPPPPMMGGPPPPPPPPMQASAGAPPPPAPPAVPDARRAFLNEIEGGMKLKHTDPDSRPKPVQDSRKDLLYEIQVGKQLKPVEKKPQPAPSSDDVMEGMAGALARALEERCRVIQSDSDDSDHEEDEDDDWDD